MSALGNYEYGRMVLLCKTAGKVNCSHIVFAFKVLQVSTNAKPEEIKKAYKKVRVPVLFLNHLFSYIQMRIHDFILVD